MFDDKWTLPQLWQIQKVSRGDSLYGEQMIEIERGRTVYEMPITSNTAGGAGGGVHGGILASLADTGVAGAVRTTLRLGERIQGVIELKIWYLRRAEGKSIRVESTLVERSHTLAVGDVDLLADSGELIARARVTYSIRQDG